VARSRFDRFILSTEPSDEGRVQIIAPQRGHIDLDLTGNIHDHETCEARRRQGSLERVLVSTYLFVAIIAVFVGLIVLVIIGMLIKGAMDGLAKIYIACREYDLLNRELDRNPQARLKDIRSSPDDDDHQDDQ
jgi:hypothetical protein